jgi:hypothetical protein
MPEFSGDDVACIIKHYLAIPETLDHIGGFNPVFRQLWVNFIDRRRKDVDENALWHEMVRLRKTGVLPRKERAAKRPKAKVAPTPKQKELFNDKKQDQGDVPRNRNRRRPRQAD